MAVQNNTKPSLAQRWENYQPTKGTLFMACAATAVATMIVGFNWGGCGHWRHLATVGYHCRRRGAW